LAPLASCPGRDAFFRFNQSSQTTAIPISMHQSDELDGRCTWCIFGCGKVAVGFGQNLSGCSWTYPCTRRPISPQAIRCARHLYCLKQSDALNNELHLLLPHREVALIHSVPKVRTQLDSLRDLQQTIRKAACSNCFLEGR